MRMTAGVRNKIIIAFFLLVLLMPAGRSFSCPIPVFRYALEYWEPDHYRVTVYHRGDLTPEQEESVRVLRDASAGNGVPANADVRLVDADDPDGLLGPLPYDPGSMPELPWMLLQYPFIEGREEPIWGGPFTGGNVEALLDSPARRKISGYLSGGTKVWLFLESGDRRRDGEAAALLDSESERLERVLELPDPEQWWSRREGAPEPEIKFARVNISRGDPAEKHLVNMLLNSERDLQDFGPEPMVFPLYGRGIALWAIVGQGINSWNLTDAAEFLVSPCSCQVKMLNPGTDLLLTKNWAEDVEMITDDYLAPVVGFEEFSARGEELRRRLEEEMSGTEMVADSPAEKVRYIDVFGEGRLDAPPGEQPDEGVTGRMAVLPAAAAGIMAGVIVLGWLLFKSRGEGRKVKR